MINYDFPRRLIEEFMLLANILTANRLREKYPDLALLRNHSPPNEKSLSLVVENLEKIGIYIDNANAGSIYHSMMRYDGFDEIGIARMAVIINLLIKPMVVSCSMVISNQRKRGGKIQQRLTESFDFIESMLYVFDFR